MKTLKLYKYQNEYFDYVKENHKKNFIYDMATGTGKSIMAINHWQYYYKDKPLLVVAPASKVNEGGWQRTISEYVIKPKFEVISYNKLSKDYIKYKDYFVVFDECHRIKNSTGVWGKSAFNLSLIASGFIMLSATPIPNGWEDIINYLKIFGLIKNKTEFYKEYCVTDNMFGYLRIIKYKNTEELNSYWHVISKRLNKEDALDLPTLTEQIVNFNRSPTYNKILKERQLNEVIYDSNMKLRHGLRLYTSLDDKLGYLKEFLESTDDNIVVFYNYNEELEKISEILKKTDKKVYQCNSKIKDYPKQSNWNNLQNTVTLANYKSGSEAVELTYANIIIYFSPTESYTEYVQSIGRCYRNGQTKKVSVYKYITTNTVENQIYESLDMKKDFNFNLWIEKNIENRNK